MNIAKFRSARSSRIIRRTLKWLTPDTWIKRCTYAVLIMAAASFLLLGTWQGIVGWLVVPAAVLLAASVFYYAWKTLSWLRNRLLWKVRNRLLVSFIFAGLAPLCIASSVSMLVGWLWIGTLGTNLVSRHIEETTNRLDHPVTRNTTGPCADGHGR